MSLVCLEGVSKEYGSLFALKDITLTVEQGDFLSIMGPSGSGKTTLLNLIGCLDIPTRGSVIIDGVDAAALSKRKLAQVRRDKVGLIFQQFHLIPYLTAVENVMLAQYYHSLPDRREAVEALVQVGLNERQSHYPAQLSGGEQQRVCIARALINDPAIVLADEPTGNLDEDNEKLVIGMFKELHKAGRTVILVTHDPEIGRCATRHIRLEHGRLVIGDGLTASSPSRKSQARHRP